MAQSWNFDGKQTLIRYGDDVFLELLKEMFPINSKKIWISNRQNKHPY